MAFVRPIVYVYQTFQSVVIAPVTPDLNCCVVGPAYYIQDYNADKTDIYEDEYVASGETKDAACDTDGSSLGQPTAGVAFYVMTNPPNHLAGGELDSASVKVMFDEVLIDIAHDNDGAMVDDTYLFTSALADFSGLNAAGTVVNATGVDKVVAGDRIVLTKNGAAITSVKTVRSVVSSTELYLTATKKSNYVTWPNEDFGNTLIKWRLEHALSDQEIDTAYYAVAGNQITISPGALGILVTYLSTTWAINYAKMYVGYRELRTDLSSVQEIASDEIVSTIGRVDERNPLAVGAYIAAANTTNTIQIFGVESDNLAGHTDARNKMTARSDIYCIVPVTDALTTSTWLSVISMWKAHCVAYAAYDKSKFRVVIGSYDELPTEKASAPSSVVGHTLNKLAAAADMDVLVDPAAAASFLTDEVTSSHLLDIMHSHVDIQTVLDEKHLFSVSGYAGAKALLGAMGEKRIRTTTADKFTSAQAAQAGAYAVRAPILLSEGVASSSIYANVTGATWGADGGTKGRITKTGAFADVIVGDVAHVSGDAVTAVHNDGFLVIAVDAATHYIDVEIANQVAGTVDVQVYRGVAESALSTVVAATRTITASGATDFANVAVGDMCVVLQSAAAAGNIGMWIVENKIDSQNIIIGDPETGMANEAPGATNVVFFRTVSSAANTPLTTRARLDRLRDDTATFTTTVETGENIQIPYPAEVDSTKWDTQTTSWPIDTIVSNELLDADLEDLEELAPELFVAGFNGDMPYRISIDLNPASQVTELNTIPTSLASSRCVMVWPNSIYVSDVENELTGVQNKQSGQYLACAVGGMVAGLPSHQGFTYIGIAGIQQIFNSNFYFTDDQLTLLRNAGWYVFVQESETSLPYTIHEVTTDVSSYQFGEFMNVKNFDYCALHLKGIVEAFLGRYNINNETLKYIRQSLENGITFLKDQTYPKIGAPLLDASIDSLAAHATEVDQVDANIGLDLPKVLNKVGLHLLVG